MFSDFLPGSFSHYGDTVTPINQGPHVCYMKSCIHSHGDLEIIANDFNLLHRAHSTFKQPALPSDLIAPQAPTGHTSVSLHVFPV